MSLPIWATTCPWTPNNHNPMILSSSDKSCPRHSKVVGNRCPLREVPHLMLRMWPTSRSVGALKTSVVPRLGQIFGSVAQELG